MSHTKSEAKPESSPTRMSRRVFLHRGAALVGGVTLASSLIACGGDDPPALTCTTGLTPQQTQMRQTMSYTDTGMDATKLCKDCNFLPPNSPVNACATCSLGLGSVHPLGSCTSFLARQV